MTTTTLSPERVRQAVWAVVAVFAVNGMGFATWSSRIPAIKSSLGLDPGQLGVLLMCVSAGSLLGLPAAGSITARIGAVRTVMSGLAVFCVGLVVLGVGTDLAHSAIVAGVGLFLVGLGIGTWDVSMNIEGAAVEQHLGRAIMP